MNAVVVIPARYASKRLPGKALLDETGKPLIMHAVESVASARLVDRVVVATDDERIARTVTACGGQAIMTSPACTCGTERVAEVAEKLHLADDAAVVNVQGDEPEMPGWCVDKVIELLDGSDAPMATLATPISADEAERPNFVKVVVAADGHALYFSRAKIPCDRDNVGDVQYYLHHGIYAYRVDLLKAYAALAPTPAEQAEKLEQLRVLESGWPIVVGLVQYRGARIDTPEEYAQFVARVGRACDRSERSGQ